MEKKNKQKKKAQVPFRLNMIFLIVFVLFSTLVLRLGVVQIVYGDDYKRQLQMTDAAVTSNSVPRGKIFDRNGKVIVDNTPLNAITYTKTQGEDPTQMLQTAERLSKLVTPDLSQVTDRDERDFWITKYPDKALKLVSKSDIKNMDNNQLYDLELKRIPSSEIKRIDTSSEKKAVAIFKQFNSGYALSQQIVKNTNVTPGEYAGVSENLDSLPGVDTTTDWERKYVFGDTLRSILGDVSSSQQGLPKEQLDQYLAEGYSRNDRVGTSYLEQEYESVLQGQKEQVKDITDQSGNIVSQQVVSKGQRGKDLVLTIDMDLQQQVEQIITQELWKAKQNPEAGLLDRAFVILMDPHTGDILTMAGKQIVKDPTTGKATIQDAALENITTSYNVGSAVKGATVLTGYKTGAIHPGSTQLDEPLQIANTPIIKSWKTFGTINDLTALQVSSNVYMWKTVIAMAGGHYVANQPLDLNPKTFDTMRQSFAQFGLGVKTGIDLPNEMAGYQGPDRMPGFLLDLAIGQYDTYTNMQLAQYVSTIANGGYRIQPHIVKEIRDPSSNNHQLGPIVKEIQPNILNRIDEPEAWIQRVQQGFKMVTQTPNGTLFAYFGNADYDPAGKSGTAQAFENGVPTMNLSMVAFAPASNPEVVMAVLVPAAYQGPTGPSTNEVIGRRVMDAYFNLKKQRQQAAEGLPKSPATASVNTVPAGFNAASAGGGH